MKAKSPENNSYFFLTQRAWLQKMNENPLNPNSKGFIRILKSLKFIRKRQEI